MGYFVSRLGSTNLSTLPSLSKSHISELVQAGRANPLVRPLRSRRSTVQYDIIPQNSYYGDNNETPTMPAKFLTDQHVLANPASR